MRKVIFLILILFTSCKKIFPTYKLSNPETCFSGNYSSSKRELRSNSKKDSDKDGIPDYKDNCPYTKNTDQVDSDKDGIGDVCDSTPFPSNPVIYVAYIDFDGYYLNSPYWNNGNPIMLETSSMTYDEIFSVISITQNSYKNYNILITTDSNIYNIATPSKRQRIVVTKTYEWWVNTNGGVSYIGSMFWAEETPSIVFSSLLGYNTYSIGVIVSHELGHTIGLQHQSLYDQNCSLVNYYNTGTSDNAPIMGNALNSKIGSWWVGPTPYGCNSIQIDTLILKSNLK